MIYGNISPESPDGATLMRRLVGEAIRRYRPEKRRVGWRYSKTEQDVREGKLHPCRNVDVIVQDGVRAGAPMDGPHGALGIVAAMKQAILGAYGVIDTTPSRDLSIAEQKADGRLDEWQAIPNHELTADQKRDMAAACEAVVVANERLAVALRREADEMDAATRMARGRLRGNAA